MRFMVKRAFTFAFYGEFLTLLSTPLGAPDTFSGACHPSLTTKSNAVPLRVKRHSFQRMLFHWCSTIPSEIASALPSTLHIENHATTSDCGKPPWGLLFPLEFRSIFTAQRVHQASIRDSGNLVTPLVQAGIQPARYYATVRASELGPLFTSA